MKALIFLIITLLPITTYGDAPGAVSVAVQEEPDGLHITPRSYFSSYFDGSNYPSIQGTVLAPHAILGPELSTYLGFRFEYFIPTLTINELMFSWASKIVFPKPDHLVERWNTITHHKGEIELVDGIVGTQDFIDIWSRGHLPLSRPDSADTTLKYQHFIHDMDMHIVFLITPREWKAFAAERIRIINQAIAQVCKKTPLDECTNLVETLGTEIDTVQGSINLFFAKQHWLVGLTNNHKRRPGYLANIVQYTHRYICGTFQDQDIRTMRECVTTFFDHTFTQYTSDAHKVEFVHAAEQVLATTGNRTIHLGHDYHAIMAPYLEERSRLEAAIRRL